MSFLMARSGQMRLMPMRKYGVMNYFAESGLSRLTMRPQLSQPGISR